MKEQLTFEDIIENIRDAMESLDGDEIAEVHNIICCKKAEYDEDSIWKYTGEEDE